MKICPQCRRSYSDDALNFCLEDGALLKDDSSQPSTLILPRSPVISEMATKQLQTQIPSIAVLPFVNIGNDVENEYFCDGLAEEILNALAKIENLKVAARTSTFFFKGKHTNISELGNVLNVKTVLEGSIRKAGNRIRITVQLINVADGYHLWSERYDREMKDIFEVQDEITLAVVDALKVKLLGNEKVTVLKRYTDNIKAYQLYLWGRFHAKRFEPEGFQESIRCYREAIATDTNYAPAYAGLADAYTIASFSVLTPNEALPKAREAAQKALEIDDGLAEAHTSLAVIEMYYDWNWENAEREFKRAIELNPGDAYTHNFYGWFLGLMGRFDESNVELKLAQTLDPLSIQIKTAIGNLYYWMREPDRAIEEYRKVLEIIPNYSIARSFLGDAYVQKGNLPAALTEFQKAWKATGDSINLALTGYAQALIGNHDEAKATLKSLKRLSKTRYVAAFEIAMIHIGLEDKAQTFKWLEKAYEERSVWLPWLKVDPKFDKLRADSRFQSLLRRVSSPVDGEHSRRR